MDIKLILILIVLVIALIVFLILSRPKKVKPISKTIDDIKDEKTEIEKVIEALESGTNDRPMTTFEEEQEANAIISYQELVEAVKAKRALMENDKKNVSKNSENPITIETNIHENPVESNNDKLELSKTTIEVTEEETKPKFKNSEFISPIFGKTKDNDEFLKELKDFRSNL